MKALIAKKVGMTHVFAEKGKLVPVTLVQAQDCVIAGNRTTQKDGYDATIIGYGKAKHPGKSLKGQTKTLKETPAYLKEIRTAENIEKSNEEPAEDKEKLPALKVGDVLDVSQFTQGDEVTISGTSKGKGFAGTVKRHNFHTGPKTHGSTSYRDLGSIGSMYPQKVYKGRKMAGQMGNDKVTIKQVTVAEVDAEQNVLALKGAVPGSRNSIVVIMGAN